ncbi:MAG TPA: hypothetical protein VK212_10760 [Lentimicrobium sp.]|nr:hypothetical protein [Lentimicrobium sp.]
MITTFSTRISKCLDIISSILVSFPRHGNRIFITTVTVLCLFISSNSIAQKEIKVTDVSEALGDRYYDAVEYLEKNTWIYDTLVKSGISPELAYSVVFPGLTRYSALKDIMETSAMRTLYVQSGRRYSKYEIGRFQMKPSFAELVERNAIKYKLTDFVFKTANNAKARSERAKRIDKPSWQVQYLILYIKIMDKRFSHIKWKTPTDKIRFYATAFNIGFNRNERAIKYFMSKRSIMRSSRDFKSKLRHGDIAAWFFENDGYKFKSDIAIIRNPEDNSEKK